MLVLMLPRAARQPTCLASVSQSEPCVRATEPQLRIVVPAAGLFRARTRQEFGSPDAWPAVNVNRGAARKTLKEAGNHAPANKLLIPDVLRFGAQKRLFRQTFENEPEDAKRENSQIPERVGTEYARDEYQ